MRRQVKDALESILTGVIILGGLALVVGWVLVTAWAGTSGHYVICAVLALPIALFLAWLIGESTHGV